MMRFLTSDLRRNITKTVCLSIGLAVGFLLIAKVYFESTYDTFFPDHDRLYRITESVTVDGEYRKHDYTPGAIAPGMKRYCPQVEAATRFTTFKGESALRLDDGRMFRADGFTLADSSFFDVLKTPVISGNPHEILTRKSHCMIPRSLADKIGGDVIGLSFCVPDFSESYKITIGGVYEDIPLNSTISNNVYVALPSIGLFSYDGSENWIGNDRYTSILRLVEGTSQDDLKPGIERMLKENLDREALEVFHFNIDTTPLTGFHTSSGTVATMIWILSFLALIMLMSAGLNYLLIVVGQMSRRGKEMAIRKCYGTGNIKIFGRIMGESVFFLAISLGIAVLLVWCFAGECQRLLGYTPAQLFSTGRVWMVEGMVSLGLLAVTGAIPAYMYCRTPVANAFRNVSGTRKVWKLALLSIQFFAAGLLMCLLVLVMRQYSRMSDTDMGFDYEQIGFVELYGVPQEARQTILSEIRKLGCVEGAASAYQDFTMKASGNNVWIGDDYTNQINVADLYYANRELPEVLGMKMPQGETFSENADSTRHEAIVEERFIDVLNRLDGGDASNIIGRTFRITEHAGLEGYDEFTVCGVIGDMKRNGFMEESADKRAGVIFPTSDVQPNLYIRFHELTPGAISQVQEIINRVCPTREIYVTPYRDIVRLLTDPVRNFGTSVMIVGIAIVVIALIGLLGYSTDEVQRRSKEIAIRKVTGTTASKIVRMFCTDILKVALPSLIAGGALAAIVGRKWLSQFTDQVSLSPLSMALCIGFLTLLLLATVAVNSLNVARSNPVDHLRNE